jgi:hypothetical protein
MAAGSRQITDTTPWYRQPWVWTIILIPGAAVVMGMITIYLAVSTDDGLVVDDYYRRGKEINRVLARDRAAAQHRLEARLEIDTLNKRIALSCRARDYAPPPQLRLSFLHPARAGLDQQVVLQRTAAGRYSGDIDELLHGHWYLQLEADDWRLSGSVKVPPSGAVVLKPAYTVAP